MTSEMLFEAIGNADGGYISEAYGVRYRRRKLKINFRYVIVAAAVFLLLTVGGWIVLARPYLVFNGEENELDIDVLYSAKILTAAEMEALGGIHDDPDIDTLYRFENTPVNELFAALNVSPLRSSSVDYDSPLFTEIGFTESDISSCAYIATDSAAGKEFKVSMTWYNTAQGLSYGKTWLMMKNYETYVLPCGAEAIISLPEPDAPKTESVPAKTWIWFTHDNIVYFIIAEHDNEEAKLLLDTFS